MTRRHPARTLYSTILAAALAAFIALPAAAFDVGIYAADSYRQDVQNKLNAIGLFDTVDLHYAVSLTPTLAELEAYDAVLVYSNSGFADPNTLGDNLADYVDNGYGVVIATFAFYSGSINIGGRIVDDDYLPFSQASQAQGTLLTMVVDDASHPILDGVVDFNGGSSSYHNSSIAIDNGADLIAHWDNGQPLIGALTPSAGTVVGLNFFPPSEDARSDFWDTATDGDLILANALLYAGGGGSDVDGDGIADHQDNCVNDPNPGQEDEDGDEIGDVCDDCTDVDGDGWGDPNFDYSGCPEGVEPDCNDADAAIHPGATEIACDYIDNDCDGIFHAEEVDDDGDGYDECSGDCDDADPAFSPGVPETPCDGLDNNCDGVLDDGEEDDDGDGYGDCEGDCNDADPAINPDATEIACDYIDNDCDGSYHVEETDWDGDGYDTCTGDCDESDATINPGAPELACDYIDNDCDDDLHDEELDDDGDAFE